MTGLFPHWGASRITESSGVVDVVTYWEWLGHRFRLRRLDLPPKTDVQLMADYRALGGAVIDTQIERVWEHIGRIRDTEARLTAEFRKPIA